MFKKYILILLIIILSISNVSAWADNDSGWRQVINLTGDTSGSQTDYQLLLNISYDNRMQSDFDDVRFGNDTNLIDCWLESKVDSSYALIWVEFPTSPANGINQTYYIYFDNSTTSNIWNGSQTFNLFDDFEDNYQGEWDVVSGIVVFTDTTHSFSGSQSVNITGSANIKIPTQHDNIAIRYRALKNDDGKWSVYHGDGAHFTHVQYDINEIISYFDGSGWRYPGAVVAVDEWELHELRDFNWNVNTFDIVHNDTIIKDDAVIRSGTSADNYTQFYIGSGNVWLDDFIVRKYVPSPPTYAWGIKESSIIIKKHSMFPTTIETDYSKILRVNYSVHHVNPLNLSSLAFLYGINNSIIGDMHNYIKVPNNNISDNGIYRAHNRNKTPYLIWENNIDITNNNVYQWSGGDNNSFWIAKNNINSTFTWINITGIMPHISPSMSYIGKTAMYEAPKTYFEISRAHSLITKMWDVELLRDRDPNYLVSMYFDTDINPSTIPNHDISIYWCNNSYNPTIDDFTSCPYCELLETWNYSTWNTHSYIPHVNSSYCSPLILDASEYTDPIPTESNYIIFASETVSSKPYLLNITNSDPGITNITFGETKTLWDYNELSTISTPLNYTPNCFYLVNRGFNEFDHHLFIADKKGFWEHSVISSEPIGISSYPPTTPIIKYFKMYCNVCDEIITDTLMDATYNNGYMDIGVQTGHDPDGGIVTHNLTLHYSNKTYITTLNNSFPDKSIVEINMTTSDYYSSSDSYTLKINITDNEGTVSESWLGENFTLAADGSQGTILDEVLRFWGYQDLPSLHTAINNESILSHNVGNDIYTMHYPFFKSKMDDTFVINHTLHLKSINNGNPSYFRFRGITNIENTSIHAWNTNTDTLAPITDVNRAYIVSLFGGHTNIKNSEVSYLGIDEYRQEGINFINPCEVTIDNSTLSHNSRGIIFEYADSICIMNSSISNNAETGIGIYFTNDSLVSNSIIKNNDRTGIRFYEANNNIISNNTISDSGNHGVFCQFSENNTYYENDVKNSASGYYDYYFASDSIDNYIINPLSISNKIRNTVSSSVTINNTNNQIFSHNSIIYTSYAYPTNFSMLMVGGASETVDIIHYNMWITPNENGLAISNIDFGSEISLTTVSPINIDTVYFNISKIEWVNANISIDRDSIYFNYSLANDTGYSSYKYVDGYSSHQFKFYVTIPEIYVNGTILYHKNPTGLIMFMGFLIAGMVLIVLRRKG